MLIVLNFTIIVFVDVSQETPIDKASFCRKFADDIVINISEKIGGVSFLIVEIDESEIRKSIALFFTSNFNSFHLICLDCKREM